ncbi:MAG: DHH family phosphoesterase [Candidatus Peribacter sp.]|nr:DHH family phosphoesterase [Candidatus Peribacter sp.]
MSILRKDAEQMRSLLSQAGRIVCICHRNPDGDAAGALLGGGMLFESLWPQIPVSFHCIDGVPAGLQFLPGAVRVQGAPVLQEGDRVVFFDCAEPKLTDMHISHPQLFDGSIPSVVIDHHPDNSRFGTVHLVDPSAASSCEIVVGVADMLSWALTPDIATCLLTGVYTDTGGLLHSNTTSTVYRTVARLLRAGARRQEIVQAVFRTAQVSTLKLWGRVLENIQITEEGGAISAVRESDFRATGAGYSELTGAIDYVNAVPGMRFSMVLSERGGAVKGSLRTLRDDVDVSAMAGTFSGGGHRRAAGFSVQGALKPEVRWTVVQPEVPASLPQAEEA